MSYKGWFRPKNPKKYKGDATNVVYRSNWELRVMKHFDEDPNVLWWASEELVIPYRSPIDQRMHRYFPDFIARVRQKTGKEKTIVIEIKPEKQTKKQNFGHVWIWKYIKILNISNIKILRNLKKP